MVDKISKSRVVNATIHVTILILLMVALWFGFRIALGTSSPFFVVSSSSMVPRLEVGDIIIVQDGGSFDWVNVGDIIVFYRPQSHDRAIVHRVIKIIQVNGERGFITKGDANPYPDSWIVRRGDYLGRVIFTIPKLGFIALLLKPPLNYVLIIVMLTIIFIIKILPEKKKDSKGNSVADV
ncbi:MAG: signal peptidase I [Nitrososphaerota archaeon]|nr:signal peptidase I [Nitrososphaerota archaeon]